MQQKQALNRSSKKFKKLSERERIYDQIDYLRSVMLRKMITYIKVHDVETCLNSLFVLSGAQVSLEELCSRLSISKASVVKFADQLIHEMLRKLRFPEYGVYQNYMIQKYAKLMVSDREREQRYKERVNRLRRQQECYGNQYGFTTKYPDRSEYDRPRARLSRSREREFEREFESRRSSEFYKERYRDYNREYDQYRTDMPMPHYRERDYYDRERTNERDLYYSSSRYEPYRQNN